jgi:hypothetical protein
MRPKTAAGLDRFFDRVRDERLYLSVLTLGEIEQGIAGASSEAQSRLRSHAATIARQFSTRILPVNLEVAIRWGALNAECRRAGIAMHAIDGLLAATAISYDLALASSGQLFERLGDALIHFDPLV